MEVSSKIDVITFNITWIVSRKTISHSYLCMLYLIYILSDIKNELLLISNFSAKQRTRTFVSMGFSNSLVKNKLTTLWKITGKKQKQYKNPTKTH